MMYLRSPSNCLCFIYGFTCSCNATALFPLARHSYLAGGTSAGRGGCDIIKRHAVGMGTGVSGPDGGEMALGDDVFNFHPATLDVAIQQQAILPFKTRAQSSRLKACG